MTPAAHTHVQIERLPEAAHRGVYDHEAINMHPAGAFGLRKSGLVDIDREADYLPCIKGKAEGTFEARKHPVSSPPIERQSALGSP